MIYRTILILFVIFFSIFFHFTTNGALLLDQDRSHDFEEDDHGSSDDGTGADHFEVEVSPNGTTSMIQDGHVNSVTGKVWFDTTYVEGNSDQGKCGFNFGGHKKCSGKTSGANPACLDCCNNVKDSKTQKVACDDQFDLKEIPVSYVADSGDLKYTRAIFDKYYKNAICMTGNNHDGKDENRRGSYWYRNDDETISEKVVSTNENNKKYRVWSIFLQGGSQCYSASHCAKKCKSQAKTTDKQKCTGSPEAPEGVAATQMTAATQDFGLMNLQKFQLGGDKGDLYVNRRINIRYCSQDFFSGQRTHTNEPTWETLSKPPKTWHTRGATIVKGIFAHLVQTYDIGNPSIAEGKKELIIFGGGSSGGRGATLHLENVKDYIVEARQDFYGTDETGVGDNIHVVGYLDSNLWLDLNFAKTYKKAPKKRAAYCDARIMTKSVVSNFFPYHFTEFKEDTTQHQIETKLTKQVLGAKCMEKYPVPNPLPDGFYKSKSGGGDFGKTITKCVFPQYRLPQIPYNIPFIVVQDQYDPFRISMHKKENSETVCGHIAIEYEDLIKGIRYKYWDLVNPLNKNLINDDIETAPRTYFFPSINQHNWAGRTYGGMAGDQTKAKRIHGPTIDQGITPSIALGELIGRYLDSLKATSAPKLEKSNTYLYWSGDTPVEKGFLDTNTYDDTYFVHWEDGQWKEGPPPPYTPPPPPSPTPEETKTHDEGTDEEKVKHDETEIKHVYRIKSPLSFSKKKIKHVRADQEEAKHEDDKAADDAGDDGKKEADEAAEKAAEEREKAAEEKERAAEEKERADQEKQRRDEEKERKDKEAEEQSEAGRKKAQQERDAAEQQRRNQLLSNSSNNGDSTRTLANTDDATTEEPTPYNPPPRRLRNMNRVLVLVSRRMMIPILMVAKVTLVVVVKFLCGS